MGSRILVSFLGSISTPLRPLDRPPNLSFMRLRRVSAASRTWLSIMARARERSATPSASRSAPLSP